MALLTMEKGVAQELLELTGVSEVRVERDGHLMRVWIAAAQPDQKLRHGIFARQISVMQAFPDTEFDFNLTDPSAR